jgi:hypothetical protein
MALKFPLVAHPIPYWMMLLLDLGEKRGGHTGW